MSRRRFDRCAFRRLSSGLVVVLAVSVAGCSRRAEQRALQDFFDASRLGDRAALGALATVRFDPATDGVVTAFTITSVEAEDPKPLDGDSRTARIAALSLSSQTGAPDRQGQLISESVKTSASVTLESGQTLQKTINVVLARARLTEGGSGGRWIVTGFTAYAR